MTTSHPSQAARLLLASAAVFLATASHAAVTAFSAGTAEVRAFLARSSTDVYAAAYGGGLWRSTDSGANWSRVSLPANERYLTALAGNTSTTIVAGGEEGVLRSTDGTTFTRTLHEPVQALAMSPGNSNTVLAAVKGGGIFRSTDSGQTWTPTSNGLTGLDIVALAGHFSDTATFYAAAKPDGAGNRGGVFKSVDGGVNWTATAAIPIANGPNQVWSLAVDSGGSLHAAVLRPNDGGGGMYKLTGGTGNWGPIAGNTYGNVAVHSDANTGTTIHSGARYLGLLTSTNGGASYQYNAAAGAPSPDPFYTAVSAIATLPGGSQVALMAQKGAGVWRSTSAAIPRTWTRVTTLSGADRVLSATHVPGSANSMVLGIHAGGVWRSDTLNNPLSSFNPPVVSAARADFAYGGTETQVNAFASIWSLAATATGQIYAAVGNTAMHFSNDPPGLYRYNGAIWQGIANFNFVSGPYNMVLETGQALPSEPIYGVSVNPADNNIVYASYLGGTKGILRRTTGPTWAQTAQPSIIPQVRAAVPSSLNAARVIALPFDDKAVKSEDSGVSYSQVTVNQTGFERLRFFAVAENPGTATRWIGATNKGVFFSADSGATWTRASAGPMLLQAVTAVGYKPSGHAFAGDMAGNRYCSADNGQSWVRLTDGAATLNAGINAIRVMNGQLYYLTDGAGAFREDGTC